MFRWCMLHQFYLRLDCAVSSYLMMSFPYHIFSTLFFRSLVLTTISLRIVVVVLSLCHRHRHPPQIGTVKEHFEGKDTYFNKPYEHRSHRLGIRVGAERRGRRWRFLRLRWPDLAASRRYGTGGGVFSERRRPCSGGARGPLSATERERVMVGEIVCGACMVRR